MKKLILLCAFLMAVAFLPLNAVLAKEADCCKKSSAAEGKTSNKEVKSDSSKSCAECAQTCEKTLKYFKKQGGKYTEAANLKPVQDCITLWKASSDLQKRGSTHAAALLKVCHAVCLDCAKMCKEMNDPKLADCIKSCEECTSCCEG